MSDVLTYYFPATFFTLAIAHLLALISPGADFFLVIGQSIRHGFKNSIWVCIGIALANAVYITLTVLGWSALKEYPRLFLFIEMLGAAYLLWIGSLFVRSSKRNFFISDEHRQNVKPLSMIKQLGTGFLSGILNPKNFIFYFSLMTGILGSQVTLVQQITCGLWMFLLVLAWDILITYLVTHPKLMVYLTNKIYLVERISGVILILIALGIVYSAIRSF